MNSMTLMKKVTINVQWVRERWDDSTEKRTKETKIETAYIKWYKTQESSVGLDINLQQTDLGEAVVYINLYSITTSFISNASKSQKV